MSPGVSSPQGSTSPAFTDKTGDVLAVTLYFICGVLLGRVLRTPTKVSHGLNLWVVNVALPALILAKLPGLALGRDVFIPVAVAWGTIALGAALVFAVAHAWNMSRSQTGALLLLVPLGNTSFLGLPVVQAVLGADHLPSALAFDQMGTFLALATYGLFVAGRFGDGERGWRPIVSRLVRFGPFVALLVSIVVRLTGLPTTLHDLFGEVGRSVAPVAVVSMGMRFVPRTRFANARVIGMGLLLKMAAIPGVVAVVAVFVGDLSSVPWQAALLESAMPPMVTAGVVGISAGFDQDLIVSMVALGTVISLVVFSAVSLFN